MASSFKNTLPTQFHHLGPKIYGVYTPEEIFPAVAGSWQFEDKPYKDLPKTFGPFNLKIYSFLPMHQTSNESKSWNVLYKPFQPELEATAESTIMPIAK